MTKGEYLQEVYQQLIEDLVYPVDKAGQAFLDTRAIRPGLAYHLVRAGWRKPNNLDGLALREEWDDPQIKKRKVHGPGLFEDAVTWVPSSDPDDPLADLQNMTVAQIEALPADLRDEAKRRLGLLPPLPPKPDTAELSPAWSVSPSIHISDADDIDESDWS